MELKPILFLFVRILLVVVVHIIAQQAEKTITYILDGLKYRRL